MAEVKIVMAAHKRGQVFVDGQEIHGVLGVELSAAADSMTEVRLTLRPKAVEIEGPADVVCKMATEAPTLAEKFSDDYKRWLFLPWWRRMFGPSPFDRFREGRNRAVVKRYGSNGPPPCPPPPPPQNPPPKNPQG